MRAFPLAEFSGTPPFAAVTLGLLAPIDHLSTDGANRNAIKTNIHFVVSKFGSLPGIKLNDGGNIMAFQVAIDGVGVVGGIQDHLPNVPLRVPMKKFMVSAHPRDSVVLTGFE